MESHYFVTERHMAPLHNSELIVRQSYPAIPAVEKVHLWEKGMEKEGRLVPHPIPRIVVGSGEKYVPPLRFELRTFRL